MKLSAALAVAVCLLTAACSRSPGEKGGAKPSSPRVDPWKVAADWPVPSGPVGDAQRFLLNAPAYQCTDDIENLDDHRKGYTTFRVVHNTAVAMESGGQFEKNGIITDGKIEFVFYHGRYGQEPGDADLTLLDQLRQASLQSLLDENEAHTPLVGSGKVNGIEAEMYALTSRRSDQDPPIWALEGEHLWVWLAKDDHHPLKVERKENWGDRAKPDATRIRITVRTYAYDPNAQVTLPPGR